MRHACATQTMNHPGAEQQEHRKDAGRGEEPSPRRFSLWRLALSRMPEWQQLESEAQRQRAYDEIRREESDPRKGDYWWALAITVAAGLAARYVSKWALSLVHWPDWVENVGVILAVVAAIVVTLWLLYRWEARQELRVKLVQFGVPVCLKCGYSLRGLTPSHERCPECGHTIADEVLRILRD